MFNINFIIEEVAMATKDFIESIAYIIVNYMEVSHANPEEFHERLDAAIEEKISNSQELNKQEIETGGTMTEEAVQELAKYAESLKAGGYYNMKRRKAEKEDS